MPTYAFDGLTPVVDATAFVHPTAVLIGDVIVGAGCYVGPGASLRGDMGRITMGPGSNIQDNCVAHSFPGADMTLEENGHVGHGAVLHGCTIRRNALVGMKAVIMDRAEVGEDSFVGALAFVKAGLVVPPRTLAIGSPARVVRELTATELAWKVAGTEEYQELAVRCLRTLHEVEPLRRVEPDRLRLSGTVATLHEHRQNR